MHHLLKRRCYEVLTGLNDNKREAYHELGEACFENELPWELHLQSFVLDLHVKLLPDKVPLRFVLAKCVFGYMCDIGHCVTH